jgi:hypothetical protein
VAVAGGSGRRLCLRFHAVVVEALLEQRKGFLAGPASAAGEARNIVQRIAGSLGTALLAVVLQRAISSELSGFHGGIGQAAALAIRHPGAASRIAHAFGTTFWVAFALTALALLPAFLLPGRRRSGDDFPIGDGST